MIYTEEKLRNKYAEKAERLQKLLDLQLKLLDFDTMLNSPETKAVINAGQWTKDRLSVLRKQLRNIFGVWEDRVMHHWDCGNYMSVAYTGEHVPVEMWFKYDPENPPEGLISPKCELKVYQETTRRLVCDVEGKDE